MANRRLPSLAPLCTAALLLTMATFLHPHGAQVRALILNPPPFPPLGGLGSQGSSPGPNEMGYGYVNAAAMTQRDRLVFVCDGCPKNSGDCQGTPSWEQHFQQNWQRLTQSGGKRKRRFATWPSWTSDPWNWSSWSTWPSSGSGSSSSTGGSAFVCPTQTNQTAVYQLNPVFTGYPAEAISAELGLNLPFFQFLLRESVLSNTPPMVLQEAFIQASPSTCPSTQRLVRKYRSLSQGQVECWVLANFGDPVKYRSCDTKTCQNCTEPSTSTTSNTWADWGWPSSSSSSSQSSGLSRKLCLADYHAVSLWAYCPTKPAGQRVVRDRIIVPASCDCRTVRCHPA